MDLDGWTPPSDLSTYEFVPPEVGPEIYAGSAHNLAITNDDKWMIWGHNEYKLLLDSEEDYWFERCF